MPFFPQYRTTGKTLMQDSRYDFRGGRVTSLSPDLLNPNELIDSTNVQLDAVFGRIGKRNGSQRMNPTALESGSPITGLTQWDSPGGKQTVVIVNGKLYYRAQGTGTFTLVTPGTLFSTTQNQTFASFRANTGSAPLYLYIGDNLVYYRWDGTALTLLTASGNALDNADLLTAYHTRMFARIKTFLKNTYWSGVGNAESFVYTGVATDGGNDMIETLSGDKVVAQEAVGSSLVLATSTSLVRFTGYSSDDIQIAQDTQGISSEVGAVGPTAMKRFESMGMLISERGFYAFTETDSSPMGIKIQADFDTLDKANLSKSIVQVHRGKREVYFIVPGGADGGTPKTIFVYSAALQAWYGPWTYSFGIISSSRYVGSDGSEGVIVGCSDGFVRFLDTGTLDDVNSDGTGGSNISMTIELAPHLFSNGPAVVKSLDRMKIDAIIPSGSAVTVATSFDGASFSTYSPIPTLGSGLLTYRQDLSGSGKRLRLQISDSTAQQPSIYGYAIFAWDMKRRD